MVLLEKTLLYFIKKLFPLIIYLFYFEQILVISYNFISVASKIKSPLIYFQEWLQQLDQTKRIMSLTELGGCGCGCMVR